MSIDRHELELLLPEARAVQAGDGGGVEALPACAAVAPLLDQDERPVLLTTTQHLRRAISSRLDPPAADAPSRRADLRAVVRSVRWRAVSARLEADWWYYRAARLLHPQRYRRLVRFRPTWFLRFDEADAVPELRISERVYRDSGHFLGPWSTAKAAQEALEGLWDLFDLCRFPEQVRRAPQGQRCLYADMGRCAAPCDGSEPLDRYRRRCAEAWCFAGGDVQPWVEEATRRMSALAAKLAFEQAALLKKQLDFAKSWQKSAARRQASHGPGAMRFLIGLRAVRRRAVKLLAFRQGAIDDGPVLSARKLLSGGAAWLEALRAQPPVPTSDITRMEQTWLITGCLLAERAGREAMVPLDGDAQALLSTLRDRLLSAPRSSA